MKTKYGLNRYQVVQGRLYGRAFVHAAVNIGVHKNEKLSIPVERLPSFETYTAPWS